MISAEIAVFSGSILLNLFTVPTLLDREASVPRIQSMVYVIALSMVAYGYIVLGILLPAVSVVFGIGCWIGIFLYRPTGGRYLGLERVLSIDE